MITTQIPWLRNKIGTGKIQVSAIEKILNHPGLEARARPRAPAREQMGGQMALQDC